MEPNKKSNGSVIGLVIIVVILVLGGIYLWQNLPKNEVTPESLETPTTENRDSDNTSETTNEIDGTADIEANLNNLDLESLDNDI